MHRKVLEILGKWLHSMSNYRIQIKTLLLTTNNINNQGRKSLTRHQQCRKVIFLSYKWRYRHRVQWGQPSENKMKITAQPSSILIRRVQNEYYSYRKAFQKGFTLNRISISIPSILTSQVAAPNFLKDVIKRLQFHYVLLTQSFKN